MTLKAIVEIDNPHVTPANRLKALDPINPDFSKVRTLAMVNLVERLGGFAYSRNRKPHQELAAAWFKAHYEAKYGSGMSAIDLTQTPVQSGHRFDKAFAELKRLAKQQDIADAIEFLGKEAADLLIQHLIFCMSVRQIAEGARARSKAGGQIFKALDRLAHKLGYAA